MSLGYLYCTQIITATSWSYIYSFQSAWHLGKLNHVAIAVPDMGKAADKYRDLGAEVSESHVSNWLIIFIPIFIYIFYIQTKSEASSSSRKTFVLEN
jgi:hypothetical protein